MKAPYKGPAVQLCRLSVQSYTCPYIAPSLEAASLGLTEGFYLLRALGRKGI